MSKVSNPRQFPMPGNAWSMVKRIIRAYGASQNDENPSVESVAKLAGIHRPVVSSNNNFLRAIGVLDPEKPKLTAVGTKLSTGIGLENPVIITEALQEIVQSTQVFNQLLNTLRARGAMDHMTFRAQVIIATGLNETSPYIAMIKTLIDILEESQLIEIREDRVHLRLTSGTNDSAAGPARVSEPVKTTTQAKAIPEVVTDSAIDSNAKAWVEMLLAKFPEFDPAWSEEVKLKWFDAFDRLMKGRGM